jgi:hypothetical protein
MCQMGLWTAQWNINAPSELSIFGGGMVSSFQTSRPEMSLPDDDEKHRDGKMQADNVVRLGNDTLFAIADELRRMYDADLRSKPSDQLEQLMRQIERGEDVKPAPVSLQITRKPK